MNIIAADADLIRQFYGAPLPRTVKAYAAVKDGRPLAISGTYMDCDRTILFADISDEMRQYKKTGVALGKRVMQMIRTGGKRVIAKADENVGQSARFLEYLGFQHVKDGVYTWQC